MSKQYPVTGGKELDAFLSAFPINLQKGAVRSGLTAAARQIREEARLRAKGRISSAIVSGSPRQNQDGTFSIRVYVDERKYYDAYTAYFQEYGVSPHFISPGNSGVSARILNRKTRSGGVTGDVEHQALKIGDNFISFTVLHPGHAAHPFMRPALDAKAGQAIEAFADQVQEYLYSRTGLLTPYVNVGKAA